MSSGWATPDYSNTRETYSRVSAFEMDDGYGTGGMRQNRFNYMGVHANKPRWQRFALIGMGVLVIAYTLIGGSDDGNNNSADYSFHDYADYENSNNNNNNDYGDNSGGSSDYAGLRGNNNYNTYNNNNNNKDTNTYGGIGPSPTPNHETPAHPGFNQDKKDVPDTAFPHHDHDIWGPKPGHDNHHQEGHDSYFHNPGQHPKGDRPGKGDKPLWHHNGDVSGRPGRPGLDGPHPNDPYSKFNGKGDKPPAKVPLPPLNELENLENEYKEEHPKQEPTEEEIQECVRNPPEDVTQVCEGHEDPVCLRKGCQHGLHHAAQHFIGSRECVANPPADILKTCSVIEPSSSKANSNNNKHQDCIKEGCRLGNEAAQLYIASNFINPNTTFTVDDPSLDICVHKAPAPVKKICMTAVHVEDCLRAGCQGGPEGARLYLEEEGGDHLATAAEEAEGLGGEEPNNNNVTETTNITETTTTEEVYDPNTGENENITITRASPDSMDEGEEDGDSEAIEEEDEKITASNETSTSDEEKTSTDDKEKSIEEETAATSTEDESVAQNSTTTHYDPQDEFALPPKDGTLTPPGAADGDEDTSAEEKDSDEEEGANDSEEDASAEEEDSNEAESAEGANDSGDSDNDGAQDGEEGASDMTLIGDIAAPNDGGEEETEAGENEGVEEQPADPEEGDEGTPPPIEDLLLMPPNLPTGDTVEQPAVPQSTEEDEEEKAGEEENSSEDKEQGEEGAGEDAGDEDNEPENSEDQDEEALEGEMESELDVLNEEQDELDKEEDDEEDWESMEEGMEEEMEEAMEEFDKLEAEMGEDLEEMEQGNDSEEDEWDEEEQENDSEEDEWEDLIIEEEGGGEGEYESNEDASLPIDEDEGWDPEETPLSESGEEGDDGDWGDNDVEEDWGDDEPMSDSVDGEDEDLDEGDEGGW